MGIRRLFILICRFGVEVRGSNVILVNPAGEDQGLEDCEVLPGFLPFPFGDKFERGFDVFGFRRNSPHFGFRHWCRVLGVLGESRRERMREKASGQSEPSGNADLHHHGESTYLAVEAAASAALSSAAGSRPESGEPFPPPGGGG